jgi:two-component system, NarL family, sensor kinase
MKKLLLYVIGFLIAGGSLTAQQMTKDSLLRLLPTAKEDTSKISLILAIQKIYSNSNFDSSFYYLNQAQDLAKKLKTDKFDYPINNKFSIYYYFNNDYTKAIEYASKAKDVAEKQNDLTLLARMYNNIAGIHNHFNHPKNAIDNMLKCLDIAEKAKDSSTFSNYNVTASETYGTLRQFDKAIMYAKKGIEYGRKYNNTSSVMNGLNNLSVCYSQLNKLDSAIDANLQQLELAKQQQNVVYTSYALVNLCYNHFRLGNTAAVKKYAAELKQYIGGLPDKQLSVEANVAFAFDFIGQKKYDLAAKEIETGVAIATAANNAYSLDNLYNAYTVLYYVQGKIKEADFYKYKSDSVLTQRNLEELKLYAQDLDAKYETEKKEAQIKLQQAEIRQRRTLNYFLIGGSIALLVILLLSYRNYRSRQKLQQSKIDDLEKERQLTATEAVLKGEEQERTRLAKDLHDGLGGMLSGIKFSLNNMKGNLIMTPDNAQAFERSIDMLDSSIKEMRRVAHNMMPEVLVKYGLDVALREFCNEIDRSGVVHVSYNSISMDSATIEQTTAVTIYRIVQELVNNAIKYAAGENVLVQAHLSEPEKLLTVTVEDDGKGFDTSTLKNSSGIGWSNIQNRVEFLKGTVDVNSQAGKGTSVLIEINI